MSLSEAEGYAEYSNNTQNGQAKNLPERESQAKSTRRLRKGGSMHGLVSDIWETFSLILKELQAQLLHLKSFCTRFQVQLTATLPCFQTLGP